MPGGHRTAGGREPPGAPRAVRDGACTVGTGGSRGFPCRFSTVRVTTSRLEGARRWRRRRAGLAREGGCFPSSDHPRPVQAAEGEDGEGGEGGEGGGEGPLRRRRRREGAVRAHRDHECSVPWGQEGYAPLAATRSAKWIGGRCSAGGCDAATGRSVSSGSEVVGLWPFCGCSTALGPHGPWSSVKVRFGLVEDGDTSRQSRRGRHSGSRVRPLRSTRHPISVAHAARRSSACALRVKAPRDHERSRTTI